MDKHALYKNPCLSTIDRQFSSHVEPVVVVFVEVVPVSVEILVGEAVLEPPVLEPLLGLPHVVHQYLHTMTDCVSRQGKKQKQQQQQKCLARSTRSKLT